MKNFLEQFEERSKLVSGEIIPELAKAIAEVNSFLMIVEHDNGVQVIASSSDEVLDKFLAGLINALLERGKSPDHILRVVNGFLTLKNVN
jgi:hypothetical protein